MTTDRDLGDPALDALLRAHSDEMPPAHVDAAILAAAHRAVDRASHKTDSTAGPRSWRWWIPLAAAATIGAVAIGVLQVAPTEPEIAPPVVSEPDKPRYATAPAEPRRATAPAERETPPTVAAPSPPIAGPSPPPQAASAQAKRPDGSLTADRMRSTRRDELTLPPETFPTQKQPALDSAAAANAPAASRGEPAAAPGPKPMASYRESASAAGRSARTASADDVAPRSADEWIERMRAFRNAGKPTQAKQALAEFRAAYPDADSRLPPDLRAWASSITR